MQKTKSVNMIHKTHDPSGKPCTALFKLLEQEIIEKASWMYSRGGRICRSKTLRRNNGEGIIAERGHAWKCAEIMEQTKY